MIYRSEQYLFSNAILHFVLISTKNNNNIKKKKIFLYLTNLNKKVFKSVLLFIILNKYIEKKTKTISLLAPSE